jgi:hypothetical protein
MEKSCEAENTRDEKGRTWIPVDAQAKRERKWVPVEDLAKPKKRNWITIEVNDDGN